jgi:hypothetical protein
MVGQQIMTPEQVVERLIGMGYFKFLPDSEWAVAREELVASVSRGYLGTEWNEDCISRERRTYPADSEELAEGGTGELILLMRDVLAQEGVLLHSVEDDVRDDRYDVVIDRRAYPIYDSNILATWDSWTIATKRLLEIVNELLRTAGSDEQLYGCYGGNDGRAMLMTAMMYDLVRSSRLITDRCEMPYPALAITSGGTIEW